MNKIKLKFSKYLSFKQREKGSVLVYSVIIMIIMLVMALGVTEVVIRDIQISSSTAKSAQAIQASNSGVEEVLGEINAAVPTELISNIWTCSGSTVQGTLSMGTTYEVAFFDTTDGAGSQLTCGDTVQEIRSIKSIGYSDNVARALEVAILPGCPEEVGDRTDPTIIYKGIEAEDGECWLDRNLGVRDDPSTFTGYSDSDGYGWLFQWGRLADDHQIVRPTPSSTTQTSSPTDIPGHGDYILTDISTGYDWRTTPNNNLWQTSDDSNNNPCPDGFRVPTEDEWENYLTETGLGTCTSSCRTVAFNTDLVIMPAGRRSLSYIGSGTPIEQGIAGYYWTSTDKTISNPAAGVVGILSNSTITAGETRNNPFSVRCIRG